MSQDVKTLDDLMEAARNKKAVQVRGYSNRMPAAFMINMQASFVHRLLSFGVTIYQPKNTK